MITVNLHVNVFDESVKHVSAQGVPTAVKRVDAR